MEDIPLEAMRQGEKAALERLVRDSTGPLLRGALAMGFSQVDAEELVQESLVAALAALKRFEGRSSLRTFLFGILYNKASELRRRRSRETAADDVEAAFDARFEGAGHWRAGPQGPEETALTSEIARIIAECARGLSEAQRAAFFLKESEGSSAEEICNALGVSGTNLRVLLFRARLKLRDCLERNWGRR